MNQKKPTQLHLFFYPMGQLDQIWPKFRPWGPNSTQVDPWIGLICAYQVSLGWIRSLVQLGLIWPKFGHWDHNLTINQLRLAWKLGHGSNFIAYLFAYSLYFLAKVTESAPRNVFLMKMAKSYVVMNKG